MAASRVPKIVLRALHKDYDDGVTGRSVAAIHDLDLTVGAQEFLCLIGPSGCGKSTLLYILGGFVPPTSGEVLIDGRPVASPGPDRGIVFQEYALFPWLTVLENIMYGIRGEKTRGGRRIRAEQFLSRPRNFDVLMQAPEAMALRAELWRLVKEEVLRAGYFA